MSDSSANKNWGSFCSVPGSSGSLLGIHFFSCPVHFTPGLGRLCPLSLISKVNAHRLGNKLGIDFGRKDFLGQGNLLDDLPLGDRGVTSWDGKELDHRVAGTRRFWPHKTGCEGFFIALLRRKNED